MLRQAMFEEGPPPIKYPLGAMPFSMGTRAPMDETDAMIAALGKDMYQEALVDFAKKEKDKYESNPSLYTAERFLEKIRELERAYPLNPKLVKKLFNLYISDLFDYTWNSNSQLYVLRDDIESATLREERILSQIRNGGDKWKQIKEYYIDPYSSRTSSPFPWGIPLEDLEEEAAKKRFSMKKSRKKAVKSRKKKAIKSRKKKAVKSRKKKAVKSRKKRQEGRRRQLRVGRKVRRRQLRVGRRKGKTHKKSVYEFYCYLSSKTQIKESIFHIRQRRLQVTYGYQGELEKSRLRKSKKDLG